MVRPASVLALLVFAASCSSSNPTTPTPPPPPPVADAPSLSCVEGVSRATVSTSGMPVSYDTPPVSGGQGSVSVSCSPQSGETFPVGTTEVKCTATDTLNRSSSCTFSVTVSKLAQLSKVKYFAFGDSITAGEVTVPVGGSFLSGAAGAIHKQVIVPSASYPAVLQRTLHGRYSAQAGEISVANYGLGGEKTINARDRFIAGLNAVRPEVVIILEGANDIPGGADGAASSAANEVRIMADEARRRGMHVFIGTPVPGKPGNKQISTFLLLDYVNRMRTVAAQSGATLIDFYAIMLPEADRLIGVDGLHPNELGYTKMADIVFQAIQSAFEVR
jgi:lysophospholipase L1-like esterase